MLRTRLLLLVVLGSLGLASLAGAAPPHGLQADETQPGWFAGRLVTYSVDLPSGPGDGPSPQRHDVTIYLVGWQPGTQPQDTGFVAPFLPLPVPQHDTVFEHFVSASAPADCFGVTVVPGAAASPDTVQTVTDPNAYPRPLAYAIRLGRHWTPLTRAGAIRAGVAQGLLALDDWPGFGGACWIEH